MHDWIYERFNMIGSSSAMEASSKISTPTLSFEPNTDKIKRNLLKKGVFPTPKIIHTLRKKETQKFNRKTKKIAEESLVKPLSESQQQQLSEEAHFQAIKREYKQITSKKDGKDGNLLVGKPWERLDIVKLKELASGSKEYGGEKLQKEPLKELSEILSQRNLDEKHWLLDNDVEHEDWMETGDGTKIAKKRELGDDEAIKFLVKRLTAMDLTIKDWKFSKLMKQSGIHFTERHLLKLVDGLGRVGSWRHALSVVEWAYSRDEYKHQKSRFVYTKILAVLGKARKPREALRVFNLMREDCRIYPDMAAYRSISVTLGQAGLVKELANVMDCMRQKPSRSMRSRDWDPCLEPDVVVYNAVLNACVPSHQWKGVAWVMEEIRKSGLKPNGATYGLAMEVMLRSGKYDLVHKYFEKMRKSGEAPRAITYKVLVKTFHEEGKLDEAVEAVREMERRGVVGAGSVYYELACCLCKNGRWKEAMMEVEKMKTLRLTKPLAVTFTGMIISCMDGGHVDDCCSVFEEMNNHCSPNIGTINAMLKVYGRSDMFAKAKELFEKTKELVCGHDAHNSDSSLTPDAFTYCSMLEASASAHQWEYFEHVYKEMALCGYQLDQNKHAWLLVEASKAGKGHLLDHAFDVILEAGEIPHLTFFTEMVCQATAQHNYERAVTLLNSMAYASFQVSEKQWTDMFMGCQDRINKEGLHNLFDRLCSSDVVTEPIVSNLSRSLQSICGLTSSTDSLSLTALKRITIGRSPSDDSCKILGDNKNEMKAFPIDEADWNLNSREPPDGSKSDSVPVYQTNNYSVDHLDDSWTSDSTSCVHRDKDTNISGDLDNCVSSDATAGSVDNRSSSSFVRRDSQDNIEDALDLLTSNVDYPIWSNSPQASDILERWRENRNKDGFFLPFK